MNKKNCDMMRDLLPLYADGICSEESKKAVNEHLAGCEECRRMLSKLNQNVAVAADKDISAIKKIKRRIRLGRVAAIVIAAVLLIGGLFGGFMWAVTDCTMDYEKYDLAENIHVEEDSEGELWLCMNGNASSLSAFVMPILVDANGKYFGKDEGFDKEKKAGFGVTLKMFRITKLIPWDMNTYEQRVKLRNDLDYVFYYDDVHDTQYVLWGEKPQ